MDEPMVTHHDPYAHEKCLRCPAIGTRDRCPNVQRGPVTERHELYACEVGKEKWKVSR